MIQNNTTVHKSFTVLLPHALFHSKGSEQPSDMIQKKYTCAQIIHSITPKSSSCMHNYVLFTFPSQFVIKVSWPVLLWCVLLTIYFSHIIPEFYIICSILCWHHKLFQNSSWFWAHILFTTWLTKFAYVTKSQWRQECFAT